MVQAEQKAKEQVQRLQRTIKEDPPPRLTDADREKLIEFDQKLMEDRLQDNRCGWKHHRDLLHHLLLIASETQCLAPSLEDGDQGETAVQEMVSWVTLGLDPEDLEEKSGYTVGKQLSAIRNFAATLWDMDEDFDQLPDRFSRIEPGAYEIDDPAPKRAQIIRFPDLCDMVREATNLRDVALLIVQWALGLRPQEDLHELRYEDVIFEENCAKIELEAGDGKSDRRVLFLGTGWTALKRYLEEEHPAHHDPDSKMHGETHVWAKLDENELLKYDSLSERFNVCAEKAGITKKHTPQHFRRSSASLAAASNSMTERDLRNRYAWDEDSDAPEHYIRVFTEPTQKSVAAWRGLNEDDLGVFEKTYDVTPVVCAGCGEWTERALRHCVWCQHAVEENQATFQTGGPTVENAATVDEKSIKELIFDGDLKPRDIRKIIEVEPHIRSDPKFFEKLRDALPKAERLYEQDDSEIIGGGGPAGILARTSAWVGSVAKSWALDKHLGMSIDPTLDGYPPGPAGTARIAGVFGVIVATAVGAIAWSGLLEDLVAGKPSAVGPLLVALLVGGWLVHRDLPGVEAAVEAAAD